jgi:ATP/maltotriose-dependent transcriptional regulator MalT
MKTHVAAIYRKLGVRSRGEAIEKARALHLLW